MPIDRDADPDAYNRRKRWRAFMASWGLVLMVIGALLLLLPWILRFYIRSVAESAAR